MEKQLAEKNTENNTKNYSIPVQNLSCEACAKVITRMLSAFKQAKLEQVSSDASSIEVTCLPQDIERIKQRLREYHYLRDSTSENNSLSGLSFFVRGIFQEKSALASERALLGRVMVGVIVSYLLLMGVYQFFFSSNASALHVLPLLVLNPIGVGLNLLALFHAHLLRKQFTCSSGMMIGMTFGMMAGFMLGAIIGATNGMFWGSVLGMVGGILSGVWAGRYVGVMGTMEGMMAGLMGGTMGAMLSVMMVTDNLIPFTYLLFLVCGVILLALMYLIYTQAGPILQAKIPSWFTVLVWHAVIVIIVVLFSVWGPKSPLSWGLV